jgi:Family of unknown function (DUF5996)
MPLPMLAPWDETAHGLHNAAKLLGVIRVLLFDHVPNYLELAMKVKPQGLSTDVMPGGSQVTLDFKQAAMVVQPANGAATVVPLTNQADVFTATLAALESSELGMLANVSGDSLADRLMTAAAAKARYAVPKRDELMSTAPFQINPQVASSYADALYHIFTGVARFRARLAGQMTPIVVWPEHFDLSTLWFAGEKPDDHGPHMNFGFAPFSAGFERPYLYIYAYPYPAQYDVPKLPASAYWNTEGWTGVVVNYDDLAKAAHPEQTVESLCLDIYKALLPLLR